MENLFTLSGRVAFVTGAGQGIGNATAKMLSRGGMKVALVDINEAQAVEEAEKICAEGGEAIGVACSISDEKSIEAAVARTAEHFGQLDVVVNCAGIMNSVAIPDITREDWDRTLAVNLSGSFFVIQKALPWLEKSACGRIINISSNAGRMGGYEVCQSYTASKGGIISITFGIARQLAPKGITVNAVCPGTTESKMTAFWDGEPKEKLLGGNPMGRLG
ncbi:MAG: SDR family NAD(P)-dependent oxidoreductase, partial [Lachnospiraceae bacterium]|nr:SDR family NAD(P)-dependent oxidoreductase [Lachnospiraceae bacterium]